ncbi:hypothetical protein DFQ27_001883 [Actinomortierella ambigua]|uniref:Adenine DNA glycosylase n=1 Tax=Actinomortierella ambigua TaxID=1343610 RepID=A0A9P6Q8V6_9FUNG|nr:hypothetical protein DFQ27_001883 [Actinomortierella ambigua]
MHENTSRGSSSMTPSGLSRPSRAASTKAALAISNTSKSHGSDDESLDESDSDTFSEVETKEQVSETQPRTRVAKTTVIAATVTTGNAKKRIKQDRSPLLCTSDDTFMSTTANVQDIEDLISDAARVRRAGGRHLRGYHLFMTTQERERLQQHVVDWYDIHHRKLPWRRSFLLDGQADVANLTAEDGQRAYEIWVSEIMCQQTQIATVIPYYNKWMSQWPTLASLAAADIEDVNKAWTGLGYYSRAKRLHEGAQKVLKEFNGILPADPVELAKSVPGIGRYTAGAIVSHAYNVPAAIVDGNVVRLLSRLRAIGGDVKSPKVVDLHWEVAEQLVHQTRPGCFNQGLMELGALVCTPTNPKCDECPVQSSCRALAERLELNQSRKEKLGASLKRKASDLEDEQWSGKNECDLCLPEIEVDGKDRGLVTQYPRKAVKKAPRDEECAVSILHRVWRSDDDGGTQRSEYLLVKRPNQGLLAGMWEFPTVEQEELGKEKAARLKAKAADSLSDYQHRSQSSDSFLRTRLGINLAECCDSVVRQDLGSATHLFSHIRKVYHAEYIMATGWHWTDAQWKRPKNCPEVEWVSEEALATAAIPTGIGKTFQLLRKLRTGKSGAKKASGGASSSSQSASARNARPSSEPDKSQPSISRFFKHQSK